MTRITWTSDERLKVTANVDRLLSSGQLELSESAIRMVLKNEGGQLVLSQERQRSFFSPKEVEKMRNEIRKLRGAEKRQFQIPGHGVVSLDKLIEGYRPDMAPEVHVLGQMVEARPLGRVTVQTLVHEIAKLTARVRELESECDELRRGGRKSPTRKNELQPTVDMTLTVSHGTKVNITQIEAPRPIYVAIAGIHPKNFGVIERQFPTVKITWIESGVPDSLIKHKASSRICLISTHGTNPRVQNLIKNMSSRHQLVNGVSGVVDGIETLTGVKRKASK